MKDPRYQYEKVNAVKIILQNKERKVLLLQEPQNNTWMPNHWGLPGGKPLEKESLLEAAQRKIKGEIGQGIKLLGLFRLEELLIEGRTVLMFIVVGEVGKETKPQGEAQSYLWVSKEEVEKMPIKEFTEYYNKKLLLNFFEEETLKLAPLSLIETEKYFQIKDQPDYKKWFESGKAKN